jgi:hypothetical protein
MTNKERETIINKIHDVVLENAKKGKFTMTKYTGTYNYKSGFDNFFALSLNTDGKPVVFSYYMNDRHEHIATDTILVDTLDDEKLQKVYDNLNTKDKESKRFLDWHYEWEISFVDENNRILAYLGLIEEKKPKTEKYVLDVNNLPELEKNDLYYIDRNHKVGVLKYVGDMCKKTQTGFTYIDGKNVYPRIYAYEGGVIETTDYFLKHPHAIEYECKNYRNKGCFEVVEGKGTSGYRLILVHNKKELVGLFKKANQISGILYTINADKLFCFETDKKIKDNEDILYFKDKDKALAKFNELKKDVLTSYREYVSNLKIKVQELKDRVNDFSDDKKYEIQAMNATPGETYVRNETYADDTFTISYVDKHGIAHVDDGSVIMPNRRIINVSDIDKVKAQAKNRHLKEKIGYLERLIETLEKDSEKIINHKPFVKNVQLTYFSWYTEKYNEYMKL